MLNESCMKILDLLLKYQYDNNKINKYELSKKLNLSYTCISKNLIILANLNYISPKKIGRNVYLELTEDGLNLSRKILDINNYINMRN